MKFTKLAGMAAAVSLAATPVVAQAAQNAPVKSAVERVSAKQANGEKLEGENGILIALLAMAAVIAGVIIIADEDASFPASP